MDMKELSSILQQNGIVGAGGAGFPTYAKLDERADTIILNCAECEPLLRLHRQLLEKYAKEIIDLVKQKGMTAVLATNPVFPRVATESRIRWAGLDPKDFALYTTYENACFCKPNPKYYLEILEKLGCQPSECLMVGNDVDEDMVAESLGMRVFLLSDCLINRSQKDISFFPNGGFAELQCFLDDLCANPLSKGTEN